MAMERATEAGNRFFVGLQGENVMIMRPVPQRLTKAEALNLAAWLVALADETGGEEFDGLLKQVITT